MVPEESVTVGGGENRQGKNLEKESIVSTQKKKHSKWHRKAIGQ